MSRQQTLAAVGIILSVATALLINIVTGSYLVPTWSAWLFLSILVIAAIAVAITQNSSSKIKLRSDFSIKKPDSNEASSLPLVGNSLIEYRLEVINTGNDPVDVSKVYLSANGVRPGRIDPNPGSDTPLQGPHLPYRLAGSSSAEWSMNYVFLAEFMHDRFRSGHRIKAEVVLGNGSKIKKSDRKIDDSLFGIYQIALAQRSYQRTSARRRF